MPLARRLAARGTAISPAAAPNRRGSWFEAEVRAGLLALLESDPALHSRMAHLGQEVAEGRAAPARAAADVLAALRRD